MNETMDTQHSQVSRLVCMQPTTSSSTRCIIQKAATIKLSLSVNHKLHGLLRGEVAVADSLPLRPNGPCPSYAVNSPFSQQ
jgi:hypothetical protein